MTNTQIMDKRHKIWMRRLYLTESQASNLYTMLTALRMRHYIAHRVSFSSCQRTLIETFQIEAMIALVTKIALVFS